eukprot:364454_1
MGNFSSSQSTDEPLITTTPCHKATTQSNKSDKKESVVAQQEYSHIDEKDNHCCKQNTLCFCGESFVKVIRNTNGQKTTCDQCSKTLQSVNGLIYIVWKCSIKHPLHSHTVIICNSCIENGIYDQQKMLQQWKTLFSLGFQKDIVYGAWRYCNFNTVKTLQLLEKHKKDMQHGVHEDAVWRALVINGQDPDKTMQWLLQKIHEEEQFKKGERELMENGWCRKSSIDYDVKSEEEQKEVKRLKRQNMTCTGNVMGCSSCKYLIDVLNKCNKLLECDDIGLETSIAEYSKSIHDILNHFHHYLFWHESNDNDMDSMHNSLHCKCDLDSCNVVQRYYGVDEENCILKTFFQLHCHFNHCYDIGYRLNKEERSKLNQTEIKDNGCGIIINDKIKCISSILNNKQTRKRKVRNMSTYEISNKFCTNLGQLQRKMIKQQHDDDIKDEKIIDNIAYSYSFKFWYWNIFYIFNSPNLDPNNPQITSRQTFVPPKYQNFKEELLQNEIYSLKQTEYDELLEQVKIIINLKEARILGSKVKENEIIKNYGIPNNQPIRLNHILALKAYTDKDALQRKFSETFRLNKNESLQELVSRHRNYHFMARYLREAVEIYGKSKYDQTVRNFYHGITSKMTFDSFRARICGVLSTTAANNVALSFAGPEGIVITMVPHYILNFFECNWLSNFPAEQELLFIGGRAELYFTNITFIQSVGYAYEYIQFVTALRCINTMNCGHPFDIEIHTSMDLMNRQTTSLALLLRSFEDLQPLSPMMKKLITNLLYHELNLYKPNMYEQFEFDEYISGMLHRIFVSTKQIKLDPSLFEFSDRISDESVEISEGGHIGYKFLEEIFLRDI